jgi:hypothetical protein
MNIFIKQSLRLNTKVQQSKILQIVKKATKTKVTSDYNTFLIEPIPFYNPEYKIR